MAAPRRRSLPDNLDSLVDTLSNVVGILIVVIALTQIEVGDALDRLMEQDAARLPEIAAGLSGIEARHREGSARLLDAKARRARVLSRGAEPLAKTLTELDRLLSRIEAVPADSVPAEPEVVAQLEERLARERAALEERVEQLEKQKKHESALADVPSELVARLPDPGILQGQEHWILCRYGRVYVANKAELFQVGRTAIEDTMHFESARREEFESLAHHFRKRDVGEGDFRWQIVVEPRLAVRLAWRDPEAGISPSELADDPKLRAWLARRSPERDIISFQVWGDSFEAYLEAREFVEASGFSAGWRAREADEELDLAVTAGRPEPLERSVEVD